MWNCRISYLLMRKFMLMMDDEYEVSLIFWNKCLYVFKTPNRCIWGQVLWRFVWGATLYYEYLFSFGHAVIFIIVGVQYKRHGLILRTSWRISKNHCSVISRYRTVDIFQNLKLFILEQTGELTFMSYKGFYNC